MGDDVPRLCTGEVNLYLVKQKCENDALDALFLMVNLLILSRQLKSSFLFIGGWAVGLGVVASGLLPARGGRRAACCV